MYTRSWGVVYKNFDVFDAGLNLALEVFDVCF